ncbi:MULTISPECIES: 4-hydroxy-tetrahydrodipicolinate synthase [unclassified Actinopolyspora]|uniref:4-hydroxy-tetrahydrodipicolinate synthase n=1 Tax=unclassified Actinopolyspora TaxID=2639451 RepID=UPI0013F691C5|nr:MULTISPECIES: 4-hydroxy-tetrahydrodipicolinate synthase [unclassified Actinopolyspora]NHD17151.1 4-hydroxy-tetrahydrodipicolinate synthase [Actinopolyspora sp. BKK2]NHE76303.1 4-hydroxy-tetrahydrodipicolinate synthase [Actinopolyspora sp. BKK1]
MTVCPTATEGRPFGRVLTAMVTPFDSEGQLDLDHAQQLATYLVDRVGNDGLIVNGTTGESPTTTDAEKERLLRAVSEAVGDRATVVAGAGTNNTAHSVELARGAEKAGAHGLLVVTPYYSKPPQEGLYSHFTTVADATDLPVMLYDIPPRSVVPIQNDTLKRLAEHPRIKAVKDSKHDLLAGSEVMANSDLAYYSGEDPLNLPWLSVGAVGFVSVVAHVVGDRLRQMLDAHEAGDVATAREINYGLLPVYRSMNFVGGVIFSKTAMRLCGYETGQPRLPLPSATDEQVRVITSDLWDAGLVLVNPDAATEVTSR